MCEFPQTKLINLTVNMFSLMTIMSSWDKFSRKSCSLGYMTYMSIVIGFIDKPIARIDLCYWCIQKLNIGGRDGVELPAQEVGQVYHDKVVPFNGLMKTWPRRYRYMDLILWLLLQGWCVFLQGFTAHSLGTKKKLPQRTLIKQVYKPISKGPKPQHSPGCDICSINI